MKFKKIRTKMLVLILPVIVLALATLTAISTFSCSSMLTKQIQENMMKKQDKLYGILKILQESKHKIINLK